MSLGTKERDLYASFASLHLPEKQYLIFLFLG